MQKRWPLEHICELWLRRFADYSFEEAVRDFWVRAAATEIPASSAPAAPLHTGYATPGKSRTDHTSTTFLVRHGVCKRLNALAVGAIMLHMNVTGMPNFASPLLTRTIRELTSRGLLLRVRCVMYFWHVGCTPVC
jgi:hypothetical protein